MYSKETKHQYNKKKKKKKTTRRHNQMAMGRRSFWNFRQPMEMVKKGKLFSMFSRIGLFVKARRSSFQGQWDCWI
jgi:hypothetical protein